MLVWSLAASARLVEAVRRHWRRILVGAFVGWVLAVVGGATTLAALETLGLVSRATSDSLAIATVLAGIGLGALAGNAHKQDARQASHGRSDLTRG